LVSFATTLDGMSEQRNTNQIGLADSIARLVAAALGA
jgi:hypothetical protein